MQHRGAFFETASERYRIKLRREQGSPYPWTEDSVLRQWRFCNVHREDDRTTIWFRDNVRSKLSGLHVVQSTMIFRWFNRIETGEIIKDLLLDPKWNGEEAGRRLAEVHPVVTGAYIVKGTDGMSKLDGILDCIDYSISLLPGIYETERRIEYWTKALTMLPQIGMFMAYEITSDLRWTDVLRDAPDIMSWANPGPGAARGLGRVTDGDKRKFNRNNRWDRDLMLELMRELLYHAKHEWPPEWRHWEMREVEHWLCEYDKYVRASEGYDLKRRYHASS